MSPDDVLTTSEIAKATGLSGNLVKKLVDAGEIKGYRLPGSNRRRVTLGALVKFCKRNGMPMPDVRGI